MSEHTPGPWEWKWGGLWAQNSNTRIVGVAGDDGEEHIWCNEADRALIEVVPDLLAACEGLCDAIEFHGQMQCDRNYDGPTLEFIEEHWMDSELPYLLDAWKKGQAAIAKAKGNP